MVKLTYLSHSAWLVEKDSLSIVIDPFLSGNPLAKHKPEDIRADYIILSHAHGDHIGDTETIAKAHNSVIIANFEIATHFGNKGFHVHPMHIGGAHTFDFGRVKLTQAFHGSSFPDGSYGGMPAGILLTLDDTTIYHTGDTGLFSDMQLIGKHEKVDAMLVCIGDNFTMGIDDAAEAVALVKPKLAIPMHYKTFDMIDVDPNEFVSKVELMDMKAQVVDFGATIAL
ncbi:MAG: metal-dependent hydrolase [Calditrichaeota bacterium]|nr:MAG: metal-dependent hydrolase [Calditrichota bacterium]